MSRKKTQIDSHETSRSIFQSFLKDKSFTRYHSDTSRMFFENLKDSRAILDTLFLQYLIDRDSFHNKVDGWFFCEVKKAGTYLCMSDFQQRETVQRLKDLGILSIKRKGVPPRRYFKINYHKYEHLISNYLRFESKAISDISIRLDSLDSNISKDMSYTEPNGSDKVNFIRKVEVSKKDAKKNPLLEYWNAIEWTRTHKDTNSKTYKKAVCNLNKLKQGCFAKGKEFDPHWKQCHLKLLNRKWTDKQLESAIDYVSLYLKDGYWPEYKEGLPKDLPTLIYNPRTKKSLLLTAYKAKPELLSESNKLPMELDEKVTNMFLMILRDHYNQFGDNKKKAAEALSTDEFASLIRGANSVIHYNDWLIEKLRKEKRYEMLNNFYGPMYAVDDESLTDDEFEELDKTDLSIREKRHICKIAKYYIQYLQEERYTNYEIEPHMIGPKSPSKNWHGFLGWLGEVLLDGTIESGQKFFRR